MARINGGSHSFTYKLHNACLFRKRSPDGATPNCGSRRPIAAYYSARRDERLSWPGCLTYRWNEPYLPLLSSRRASPHFGRYSSSEDEYRPKCGDALPSRWRWEAEL